MYRRIMQLEKEGRRPVGRPKKTGWQRIDNNGLTYITSDTRSIGNYRDIKQR